MAENNESPTTINSSEEIGDWIFSLIPVGVAFLFYVVFILQSDLENKNIFFAYGAAAGFTGLETYWILQGWRNNRKRIVVMGLTGIAITLGILYVYLSFTK
ncbi:MAG: hypothetical protein GQ470_03195 [Gammaproteobacteria bacterium]|nr:hypothetical protein [Gammaproteobacteria bacterium]